MSYSYELLYELNFMFTDFLRTHHSCSSTRSKQRSEAFYDAAGEAPSNPQVLASKAAGLTNVRVLSNKTPHDVLTLLGFVRLLCS